MTSSWRRYWPGVALLLAVAGNACAASDADQLTAMINAYRAAPGTCDGAPAQAVAALTPQPALARVHLEPDTVLAAALDNAGYANMRADALSISGASDLRSAMAAIKQIYCDMLLDPDYTDVGSSRNGDVWTVVLARSAAPLPSSTIPDWRDAGLLVLDEVNLARASRRKCGEQAFEPAPPLQWNPLLGAAAFAHSSDMADKRYFNHRSQNGDTVSNRTQRVGYNWQRIGENIAFGSYTPKETVNGWLASPGHCVNIMDPTFTEMGAAYAVSPDQRVGKVYWTQVFGRPR